MIRRRLGQSYETARRTNPDATPPLVVAVDLQEMAPIEGVVEIQGDITCMIDNRDSRHTRR